MSNTNMPELPEPILTAYTKADGVTRFWKYDGMPMVHEGRQSGLGGNKPIYLHDDESMRAYGELCRAAPAGGDECEVCKGAGTVDETLGGYAFSNPKATCPECDGLGEYRGAPAGSGEAESLAAYLDQLAVMMTPPGAQAVGKLREAAAILRKLSPAGSGEVRSTHHVHRGPESLPCYCAGTSDHPIGHEVPHDGERLAREFHETYERLAPSFGYETRQETRQFDPTTPNGRLMIAVCAALLRKLQQGADGWRPIESAPRNEEVVVFTRVGNPSTREGVCIASFSYEDEGDQWWICDSGDYVLNPSHWRPLPDAPASQDQDGGKHG